MSDKKRKRESEGTDKPVKKKAVHAPSSQIVNIKYAKNENGLCPIVGSWIHLLIVILYAYTNISQSQVQGW